MTGFENQDGRRCMRGGNSGGGRGLGLVTSNGGKYGG